MNDLSSLARRPEPPDWRLIAVGSVTTLAALAFAVWALHIVSTGYFLDTPLLWGATVAGAGLGGALGLGVTHRPRGLALLVAVMAGAFAWVAAAGAVRAVESTPPQAYRATVVKKCACFGRYGSDGLVLAPWGPARKATLAVGVDHRLYLAAAVGRPVIVRLHRGLFGVRWYDIAPAGR